MLLTKREVIEELVRLGLKGYRLRKAYRDYNNWAHARIYFATEGEVAMQWQDTSGKNGYWVLGDPSKPQAYIFRLSSESWAWAAGGKDGQAVSRSAAQAAAERALQNAAAPTKREKVSPDDLLQKKGTPRKDQALSGFGHRTYPY